MPLTVSPRPRFPRGSATLKTPVFATSRLRWRLVVWMICKLTSARAKPTYMGLGVAGIAFTAVRHRWLTLPQVYACRFM